VYDSISLIESMFQSRQITVAFVTHATNSSPQDWNFPVKPLVDEVISDYFFVSSLALII
jgi:hypothetical protein